MCIQISQEAFDRISTRRSTWEQEYEKERLRVQAELLKRADVDAHNFQQAA
jgi:hypothetical protein